MSNDEAAQLKVGDRVRMVNCSNASAIRNGEEGEIRDINERDGKFAVRWDRGRNHTYFWFRLERCVTNHQQALTKAFGL